MRNLLLIALFILLNSYLCAQVEQVNLLIKNNEELIADKTKLQFNLSNSWGKNALNLFSEGRNLKMLTAEFEKKLSEQLLFESRLNYKLDYRRNVKKTLLFEPLIYYPFNLSDDTGGNLLFKGPELSFAVTVKKFFNTKLFLNYEIIKGNKDYFSYSENTFRRFGLGFKQSVKIISSLDLGYGVFINDKQNNIEANDINNGQIPHEIFIDENVSIKRTLSSLKYKNSSFLYSPFIYLKKEFLYSSLVIGYVFKRENVTQNIPFDSFLEKELTKRNITSHIFGLKIEKANKKNKLRGELGFEIISADDYYSLFKTRLTNYKNQLYKMLLGYDGYVNLSLGLNISENNCNSFTIRKSKSSKNTKFFGKLLTKKNYIGKLSFQLGIVVNEIYNLNGLLINHEYVNNLSVKFNFFNKILNKLEIKINYYFQNIIRKSNFNSMNLNVSYIIK